MVEGSKLHLRSNDDMTDGAVRSDFIPVNHVDLEVCGGRCCQLRCFQRKGPPHRIESALDDLRGVTEASGIKRRTPTLISKTTTAFMNTTTRAT
jgi:hypothetical protein